MTALSIPPGATDRWQFDLSPIEDLETVRAIWQELETRSDHSFFLSWGWIGSWLGALPKHVGPSLLCVKLSGRVVGLSVVTRRTTWRRSGIIRSTLLSLNETGDPAYDGITVEHNGLLAERSTENEVFARSLNWLCDRIDSWDELTVRCVEGNRATAYRDAVPDVAGRISLDDTKPYYFVDLAEIRSSGGDALASLSRNTRYQIRRSMKKYSESGELTLRIASSIDEARSFLGNLRQLHESYWNARGEAGAFAGDFRRVFHRNLIEDRFPHGEIHLLEISCGSQPIGYLYNFSHNNVIANYQSGFNYLSDSKYKPGLVSHSMAVQHYVDNGADTYDFLMGQHRYKESLSNHSGTMVNLVYQQPRLRFRVETALRNIKNRGRVEPSR